MVSEPRDSTPEHDPRRSRASWALIAANVVFTSGLFVHAFLYNFYLEGLGLATDVMGNAAAALTAGGLVSLLPAGLVTDGRSPRLALIIAGIVLFAGLAAGAIVERPFAIYAAAAVAGAGGGIWRVAVSPALMRLTTIETRPRVFAWNVGLLITVGGIGMAAAGAVPEWVEVTLGVGRLESLRLTLVLGAAGSALSVPLFAMLRPVASPHPRSSVPDPSAEAGRPEPMRSPVAHLLPDRMSLRLLAWIGVWMLGPALVAPFLNIFFTRRFDVAVAQVGVIFAAAHLLWGASVFASGALAARAGVLRVLTLALGLYAPLVLGMAWTSWLPLAIVLYACQGVIGPMTNPLIDQLLLGRTPAERQGAVSAWRNAAADLSALAGASLGGILLARTSFATLLAASALVGAGGATALILALRSDLALSAAARRIDPSAGGDRAARAS